MEQVLPTRVNPRGDTFRENYEQNLAAVEKLRGLHAQLLEGGGKKYQDRHRKRGKLLPRERIERLLDPGSYFLELSPLAAHGIEGFHSGASIINGIGVVAGVECMIGCNESTIKGGSVNPYTLKKSLRAAEIARSNRLPGIHIVESGGADLPHQAEVFSEGGKVFRDIARHSAMGIPQISLVFGSSTAGGAYIPGMSDYVVMVRNQAKVFLAGPPLVKMATNEEVDDESLGGAAMHSQLSGVSDYLAEDDADAIRLGREIVAGLNWQRRGESRRRLPIEDPLYSADEILGIASHDIKKPFEIKEIIARLVDGSRFSEFKATYGPTLVCGFAHLHGYPIGIVANNGILFSESALKGAHFIQLCNQKSVPIIYLQNITGFMVGRVYEEGGIVKNGAKMVNAVATSRVPQFTVMVGASYGAGNYAMCGRAYQPRLLFTWPNHRIAVMGAEQLAGVLKIVRRSSAASRGLPFDEAQNEGLAAMVQAKIEAESDPYYATARLWDDGIIDPRETRTALGIALSVAHNAAVDGEGGYGVFRM